MTAHVNPAPLNSTPILLRETHGPIAILTLNRPVQSNSLSEGLIADLQDALDNIRDDTSVRAVVIAANGAVYSAGHDLKEIMARRRTDADQGRKYFADLMTSCSALMQTIVHLPKPVIAAVQGIATAAGCQLVASCDLAIASEAASFQTPGVDIGLFCSTPMVALSRNVTRKQAMEMLLTAIPINANEAKRIGLVNRVVAAGREREEAIALGEFIARRSAHVVKIGKEAFYRQAEMPLAEAYNYTSQVMIENMLARDAVEGIGAFIEKRDPKWEDR
jgi:enoyl-CoA hydratase/carnithine racemase